MRGKVVVQNAKYLGALKDVVVDGMTYRSYNPEDGQHIPDAPIVWAMIR